VSHLSGRSLAGARRGRLISTAEGSRAQEFGPAEWGLFGFCGVVWGGSFYLIAESVDHFAPGVVALLRLGFGALVVAAAPAARARVARGDWPRIVFVSIVWMAIPFVLFPIAERAVASSVAGMINAGLPVFAAIIAAVLLRRLPGRAQAAGLAVGLVGVALIAVPSLDDGRSSAIGVAELVLAVALYGLALNVIVPLQQRYGTLPILLRTEVVAALALVPYAALGVDDSTFAWSSLGAVAALGVAGTGLAFLAMFTLVGRVGATRASAVTYLFPVVAIALGVPLRDEPLEAAAVVGTALVLVGAWLVSRRERGGA